MPRPPDPVGVRKRLSSAFDAVFPKRCIVFPGPMRAVLLAQPVTVIDVGGAMGPDPRFAPLRPDLVRFMMFEPDARSQNEVAKSGKGGDIVLPIGLADAAGQRTLHLTQGSFASSLYPPNLSLLNDFAVAPWYQPAGTVTVSVDTLDGVLAHHPDWRPDFVKVDVEGADLDILRAGEVALASAYGVQIEVSFAERNLGAPYFAEADLVLREQGFELFNLSGEHWVRTNGCHGATSATRLMWADAVYIRPPKWVLSKMEKDSTVLVRAVALLLVYQAHDTAADLINRARAETSTDNALLDALQDAVETSLIGLASYGLRGTAALIAALAVAVPLILLGRRGRSLAATLVSTEAAPLFAALSKAARRTGLDRGCIPDARE